MFPKPQLTHVCSNSNILNTVASSGRWSLQDTAEVWSLRFSPLNVIKVKKDALLTFLCPATPDHRWFSLTFRSARDHEPAGEIEGKWIKRRGKFCKDVLLYKHFVSLLTCRTNISLSSSSALDWTDLDFFTEVESGGGALSEEMKVRLAGEQTAETES